jgi:hypothetical protein
VFFTRTVNRRLMDGMLGFAAGVMIAASYWSLLAPAIEMSHGGWIPAAVGFMSGGIFLWGVDKILPHLHPDMEMGQAEGVKTSWQRSVLLVMAITLHNIPEGLAVGVAFGAAASLSHIVSTASAIALAVGIGIQNFPEGMAIALPLRREGMSMGKSFWYGQLSGMVEPIAGVIGAAAVLAIRFPVKLQHNPIDFIGKNIFTTNVDDYCGYDLIKTGLYPWLSGMTMFSSDYPHSATIWPDSRKVAARMIEGMKPEDARKALSENAARVFGFDLG